MMFKAKIILCLVVLFSMQVMLFIKVSENLKALVI